MRLSGNMQSQASFNVFHVNHLNDISENPFHFAVRLTQAREWRSAPAVRIHIGSFPLIFYNKNWIRLKYDLKKGLSKLLSRYASVSYIASKPCHILRPGINKGLSISVIQREAFPTYFSSQHSIKTLD